MGRKEHLHPFMGIFALVEFISLILRQSLGKYDMLMSRLLLEPLELGDDRFRAQSIIDAFRNISDRLFQRNRHTREKRLE